MVRRGLEMQGSEVRSQSPTNVRLPVGFSGREGGRGRVKAPGWWLGRTLGLKNLTCDPGHPHKLKGLRDGRGRQCAVCVGACQALGWGWGVPGHEHGTETPGKGPEDRNPQATGRHQEARDQKAP